ncbi:MAG: hypothetical protein ACT4PT_02415 [Methanobacteriota archaeon]
MVTWVALPGSVFDARRYADYNRTKMGLGVEEFDAERRAKFRFLAPFLVGRKAVIDYGAGSGWLGRWARGLGVDCFDADDLGPNPFRGAPDADLVFSLTVLEHQSVDEADRFFAECERRGIPLVLATNNPECLYSHYVLWDDITHKRLYTQTAIEGWLRERGWTVHASGRADPLRFRDSPRLLAVYEGLLRILNPWRGARLWSPYNLWWIHASPGTAASGAR